MTSTFAWNPDDVFRLYRHRPLPDGCRATITVAEFAPPREALACLADVARLAEAATADGAELVVLPERPLTGLDEPAAGAVPVKDPPIAGVSDLPVRSGTHLLAGLAEKEGERCFDSAVFIGPEGLVEACRKLHLNQDRDDLGERRSRLSRLRSIFGRLGLHGHPSRMRAGENNCWLAFAKSA